MWKVISYKNGRALISNLNSVDETKYVSYYEHPTKIKMDDKFFNLYLNRIEESEDNFFIDLAKEITEEDLNDVYYIGQIVKNLPTHYFVKLIDNPHIQILAEQPTDYLLQDLEEGTLVLIRLTTIDLNNNKIRGKIIKKI